MDFEIKERYDINDLLKIIEMLRDKDNGCPWDKVQTHKSIRKNFIEETYEAVEAIDKDDKQLMEEELGDVLLQILLHAQFEKEEGVFDFSDVVNRVSQKLVLRHPHIFAGYDNNTVEGVLEKWEEIKKQEKGQSTTAKTLEDIPKTFPALMYAQKLWKRAAAGGLVKEDEDSLIQSLENAVSSIKRKKQNKEDISGDLALILHNTAGLCHMSKNDAEEILSAENAEKLKMYIDMDNNN